MAWSPLNAPVNKFLLSGVWSPGVCLGPVGPGIEYNLDERQGYGIDFAYVFFTGRKLGEFDMPIILITQQDWDDWYQFAQLLETPPQRGPVNQTTNGYTPGKAKTIWHPILVAPPLRITQCVIRTATIPQIQDDMRTLISIPFKQVKMAPRPAYARPMAAADKPPLTPEQQEIQDKTRRNQAASDQQVNQAAGLR